LTAMTPEETANLGILLADLGEPPSSIGYAMTRRIDELRDLMASRDFAGRCVSEAAPVDPEAFAAIVSGADRIAAGESLLTVFGELSRLPLEKL